MVTRQRRILALAGLALCCAWFVFVMVWAMSGTLSVSQAEIERLRRELHSATIQVRRDDLILNELLAGSWNRDLPLRKEYRGESYGTSVYHYYQDPRDRNPKFHDDGTIIRQEELQAFIDIERE